METAAFYMFAVIAVLASLLVVGQRNPMYSVMLLIVSFGALAGLYVLLDAPFTAVTQIIIYAGAIMVLFLFVVMLLNIPREEPLPTAVVGMIGPAGAGSAASTTGNEASTLDHRVGGLAGEEHATRRRGLVGWPWIACGRHSSGAIGQVRGWRG